MIRIAAITSAKQQQKVAKKKQKKQPLRLYDRLSIFAIVSLLIISVIFVFSTTTYHALFIAAGELSPFHFVSRHVMMIFFGLIAYFVVSKIPTSFYEKHWLMLSCIVILLMFGPLFFADRNGAHRWIELGPIDLQPSELAKIVVILITAASISKQGEKFMMRLSQLTARRANFKRYFKLAVNYWLVPFVMLAILLLQFKLQSDNGSLVISLGLIVLLIFASGILPKGSLKFFLVLMLIVVGLICGVYLFLSSKPEAELQAMLKPSSYNYVLGRFVSWVNPFAVYIGDGYQLSNSLIAISQGGFFGRGIGNGIQKQGFLAEGYNDFIIANIAEEAGIVGLLVIYMLYIIIIIRGIKIARESAKMFDCLFATGIVGLFFFQAFWNSAGTVGLLPMKGLTAPLLSYGGTSIIIMLASLGILQRINIQNRKRAHNLRVRKKMYADVG